MTFDSRAGRAAQGIHRAVELMEMSSSVTPQRLTRFEEYRERKSRNQRVVAIAVGIAVPVALLMGAVRVLGSNGDQDVPGTTPSTSITPTSVSGRSDQFRVPFTYTLTQDWTDSGEDARYFALDATDGSAHLIVLSDVVANTGDCSARPRQGVGTSSDAITNWLSRYPALDASTPRSVRLGAATGSYVDVQLASDQNPSCPDAPGLGLVTAEPAHPQGWSIEVGSKERFYVLDRPAGGTVTIVITAYQARDFQSVIDQATPVVESFRFLK
jgi:hypothetical protein